MKQHKWHKEIVAWANGAEIECQQFPNGSWQVTENPSWNTDPNLAIKYRIKPQPKEPQYLYVWMNKNTGNEFVTSEYFSPENDGTSFKYIGKIKLEQDDGDA